jgi:hypothetical protein
MYIPDDKKIQSALHTPGPWMVCPELNAFDIKSENPKARTKLGDTHTIASATFSMNAPISADEFAANARLIAAAPTLFAALRMIADSDVGAIDAKAIAQKALAETGVIS